MSSKRILATPEKGISEPPKKSSAPRGSRSEIQPGGSGHAGGAVAVGEQCTPEWFTCFLQKFSKLEEKIDNLVIKRLEVIAQKAQMNEEKIEACGVQLNEVVAEVRKLRREKEELDAKLDDLENRARRNNLVLHGIPEVKKEVCEATVREFLSGFVGVSESDFTIERCHRTPTVRRESHDDSKPRIIHIAFTSYGMKEKVRKASIAKLKEGGLYKGSRVFVSEDFSQKVLNKRREKKEQRLQLKAEGKKPFFMYPARLAYRDKDGKLIIV